MNNLSSPSYIFNRTPLKYGCHQGDYQKRIQALKSWGARMIRKTPKDEKALSELFFNLLEKFSLERQTIARDHRTENAECFGCRRDKEGTKDFYYTLLDEAYHDYNTKILEALAKHMWSMSLKSKETSQRSKKIEETYLDRSFSLEIEILEGKEIERLKWNLTTAKADYPPHFPFEMIEKRQSKGKLSSAERQEWRQAMKKLKESNLTLYKRIKMLAMFDKLQTEFPSPKVIPQANGGHQFVGEEGNLKSFYVLATARHMVKGKMYAATQYLTWLYRDFQSHPIDRMLKDSKILLIHQDHFLVDDTLQEIAQIFTRTVLSNTDSAEFSNNLALFRHYFAHNMPCERGSAAIAETFEGSICGAKDLNVTYNPGKQMDLEAFASPLFSDFMANHASMVTWKAKESKKIP